MPGCFGLDGPQRQSRTPLDRLVEAHPVVDCFELYRRGLLSPGTAERLETDNGGGWRSPQTIEIRVDEFGALSLDGQPIRLVPHKALPLRAFQCPGSACLRDVYRLHRVNGIWLCRICHDLDYASRHRHRSVPGLARLAWLRKRIGASSQPFASVAPRPIQSRRHIAIVLEIRRIEAGLVAHLRDNVATVLERRNDAKRRRRRA